MKCETSDLQKCGFRMGWVAKINVSSFCEQQWKIIKNTFENTSKNLQKSIPEAFQKHLTKSNVNKTENKSFEVRKMVSQGGRYRGGQSPCFYTFPIPGAKMTSRPPQWTPKGLQPGFAMRFPRFVMDLFWIFINFTQMFLDFQLSTTIEHRTSNRL